MRVKSGKTAEREWGNEREMWKDKKQQVNEELQKVAGKNISQMRFHPKKQKLLTAKRAYLILSLALLLFVAVWILQNQSVFDPERKAEITGAAVQAEQIEVRNSIIGNAVKSGIEKLPLSPMEKQPLDDPKADDPIDLSKSKNYSKINQSNTYAKIEYLEDIESKLSLLVLYSSIKLSKDSVGVDSWLYPELDKSARITYYTDCMVNPSIAYNGIWQKDYLIDKITETKGKCDYQINVEHFSTWTLFDNTWNGTFVNTTLYNNELGLSGASSVLLNFDANSTIVTDSSVNNVSLTTFMPYEKSADCIAGSSCLEFHGGSAVKCMNVTAWRNQNYTLSVLVRFNTVTPQQNFLNNQNTILYLSGSKFYSYYGGNINKWGTNAAVNQTYLVTLTYNGTDSILYINDTSVNVTKRTSSTTYSGSCYFGGETGVFFNGTAQCLRVWDFALSENNVTTLWDDRINGCNATFENPKSTWHLQNYTKYQLSPTGDNHGTFGAWQNGSGFLELNNQRASAPDGTSSGLTYASSDARFKLVDNSGFTIMWDSYPRSNQSWQILIWRYVPHTYGYRIAHTSGGISVSLGNGSGITTITDSTSPTYTWNKYAVTYDNSSKIFILYENCTQVTNGTVPNTYNEGTSSALFGDSGGTGTDFNGLLDNIKLVERALTPTEMSTYCTNNYLYKYLEIGNYTSEIYNSSDNDTAIHTNVWQSTIFPSTPINTTIYGRAGDCSTITSALWSLGVQTGGNYSFDMSGQCSQYLFSMLSNSSYTDLISNVTVYSAKYLKPNISSINIYPANVTPNQTIYCNATFLLNDTDAGSIVFYWYKNEVAVETDTINGLTNYSVGTASSNFSKNVGDIIYCSAYSSIILDVVTIDGDLTLNSSNVTVYNFAPAITSLILNTTAPTNNNTNQNLTAYVTTSDADGNTVKPVYNWYLNETSILVLNMPFEGGSNSSWTKDYSQWGNNATPDNPMSWNSTGGYDGKGAYSFDGYRDYFIITHHSSLNFTANITVAAWVNPIAFDPGDIILSKGLAAAETVDYDLRLVSGVPSFGFYESGAWKIVNGTGAIPLNSWTFITGTFNGATLAVYVNGFLNSTAAQASNLPSSNGSFIIGDGSFTKNVSFNGTLDEFRIYNRTLSAAQILALYQNKTDVIVSDETKVIGEIWKTCVTPNDGYADGAENCSNNVTILNAVPQINALVLNTTNTSNNNTNQNLTAYVTTSDVDSDPVKPIYNWYKNEVSEEKLNMPFEGSSNSTWTKDYSGFGNNGSVVGATQNSTGGYDGKGAYKFDGKNDWINISHVQSLNLTSGITIATWIYMDSAGSYPALITKSNPSNWGFLFEFNSNTRKIVLYLDGVNGDWTKSAATAVTLSQWTHLAATWNKSVLTYYVNGNWDANYTFAGTTISNNIGPVFLGRRYDGQYFNGSLDDVRIYNYSLSAAQILALYNNKSDTIVSNGLAAGDIWKTCVTPNDGTIDGAENCSNNVTVNVPNTLPAAPTLLLPLNNASLTNRTPTFAWNNSYDADGNLVTYNLVLDDNSAFNNPEINVTGIVNTTGTNTTYTAETELAVDTVYFWKVIGNDSWGYGDNSSTRNFTLSSYLAVTVLQNAVNFGNLSVNESANTSDSATAEPFRVENAGNVVVNITVTATPYFTAVGFPSSNYQFRIEVNETSAFNTTLSYVNWTNTTNVSSVPHVLDLDWHDYKDDFLTGLSVLVPATEDAGVKTSTVTFTVS